ncbi:MAG TPA: zinc ribbon domain-containing protein [Pyrinomonadaceae bacterium]|jgi:hypothetical protein|nr:zinc ribbon domain-containing protein [Pyrinomonadaceae bacterium]
MHCPNCGRKTSSELKFCRACGMKLDSVARAVSSHLEGDEPDVAVEKKSGRGSDKRFYALVYIGLALSFIGPAIVVLGQGVWGTKSAGILIALLGMFSMAMGALPAAARFDRALLRSLGTGGPKRKESAPDHPAELEPGDDFEPVSSAVPSVTEGTTRDLDKNKTKVLR